MPGITRAALYIRVSTTEQASEGYSLDAQREVLTRYCTERGYEIVEVYADEGISAKDIKHREAMRRMLNDVAQKRFEIIVVWKLSRLTRSLIDLCRVNELLDKYSARLVSCSEAFDYVSSGGRLLLHILGTVAEFEQQVISENVKLGMDERARQGKRTCTYILGYDLDGDGLAINQTEAEIVHFIYDTYEQVQSLVGVSDACAKVGYHGKMGGPLAPESVRKILMRFTYTGRYAWHRQPLAGNHEAIISVAQYNRVQRLMDYRAAHWGGRHRKHELCIIPDRPPSAV